MANHNDDLRISFPVRVLLAEDNRANQLVAKGMFRRFGCDLTIAENGAEAVEMAAMSPFDIIFMDCSMPVLDGYEATREIRADSTPNSKTPIIAMTAHAMQGDREKCLDAGMDDHIPKPIERPIVRDAIMRYCAPSGTPLESPFPPSPKPPEKPFQANPGAAKKTKPLPPVLDESRLFLNVNRDIAMLDAVLEAFIEPTRHLVESLRNHIHDENLEMIEQDAHAIAGSAANLGGKRLEVVAKSVENAARMKQAPACAILFRKIPPAFEEFAQLLQNTDWKTRLSS